MDENICKVCGTRYPATERRCPHCGCRTGAAVPAYLKCRRCGTVMPSARKRCPGCGDTISPATATAIPLSDVPQKPRRNSTWWKWALAIAGVIILLTGEALLVRTIYANITCRESLRMWDCGGSVEANRRNPDPYYGDVTLEQQAEEDSLRAHRYDTPPDSTADDGASDAIPLDSIIP